LSGLILKGTGFLLSPYWSAEKAHAHAAGLGPKEGKAIQILADPQGIQQLLQTNSGYCIFNNHFHEEEMGNRMYETKIVGSLRQLFVF